MDDDTMICAVITGPSFLLAKRQIQNVVRSTDFVELRLDLFSHPDVEMVQQLREEFPSLRMIFTLRPKAEGGNYDKSEEKRYSELKKLLELKPEWIDLELGTPSSLHEEVRQLSPNTKLLISNHAKLFDIDSLKECALSMASTTADAHKIAMPVSNILEALSILEFLKDHNNGKMIVIGSGSEGNATRILSKKFGSLWTYAAVDNESKTDPGQLSVHDLAAIYRIHTHTPETEVYALIGDPIEMSIGHYCHNYCYEMFSLNAVYLKMRVSIQHLEETFKYLKRLGFNGLSVTMPLKKVVAPLLEYLHLPAMNCQSVNTVLLMDDQWMGFNTDGVGAADAIEEELLLKDKRVLILGTGGAASAVAHELKERGAKLTLTNRTEQIGRELSQSLKSDFIPFGQVPDRNEGPFDLILNTLPNGIEFDFNPYFVQPPAFAMDITTRPKLTQFLILAENVRSKIIYGERMYIKQGVGQLKIWFADGLDLTVMEQAFRSACMLH